MSKVINKNASLAFVLLLSIPVCASQHDTAENLKKVSQSNAIAAAFGTILAKSGVKTAGQNAFAWTSRTLPSWQTVRQAPRTGLALVKRGTTAVVNAGKHASSCVALYAKPVVNFTRAHPRMAQAAFGSLFATGLTYAVYKAVRHLKAQKPTLRTTPVDENAVLPLQTAATADSTVAENPSSKLPQQPEGASSVYPTAATAIPAANREQPAEQQEAVQPAVTAPSLEDARQHINQLEEEIRTLKAVKAKMATTHNQFVNIEKAARAFINTLAKENVTRQEIAEASENYFRIYTDALCCGIGAVPEKLTALANHYNTICTKILDICYDPMNFNNKQKFAEITQLWTIVKNEIVPQINTEIQNLVDEKTAIEMSLEH